jgi:hypothetical protein
VAAAGVASLPILPFRYTIKSSELRFPFIKHVKNESSESYETNTSGLICYQEFDWKTYAAAGHLPDQILQEGNEKAGK